MSIPRSLFAFCQLFTDGHSLSLGDGMRVRFGTTAFDRYAVRRFLPAGFEAVATRNGTCAWVNGATRSVVILNGSSIGVYSHVHEESFMAQVASLATPRPIMVKQ